MSRHRRCDSRCVNAHPGSPCSCQCGGRNHAGGYQPDDPTQPRRSAPTSYHRHGAALRQHEANDEQLTLTLA
jgi:hypothetical protein